SWHEEAMETVGVRRGAGPAIPRWCEASRAGGSGGPTRSGRISLGGRPSGRSTVGTSGRDTPEGRPLPGRAVLLGCGGGDESPGKRATAGRRSHREGATVGTAEAPIAAPTREWAQGRRTPIHRAAS